MSKYYVKKTVVCNKNLFSAIEVCGNWACRHHKIVSLLHGLLAVLKIVLQVILIIMGNNLFYF